MAQQSNKMQIVITVGMHETGPIVERVNGFPQHVGLALGILDGARALMTNYFLNAAREGRLDEHGNAHDTLVQEVKKPGLLIPH